MLVEAMLDFPEEDIEIVDSTRRDVQLHQIQFKLCNTLQSARQGSLLREGAHVVLVGRPNVGKSSLLNKLSGQDVALVSDVPGTTRDVIRQAIQIRGVPLHIIDTAGLRESQDAVENMGIARTHQTLQRADLILLLLEANQNMTTQDEDILTLLPAEIPRLQVFNKADLLVGERDALPVNGIYVSAKTGAGMEALRDKMLELVGWRNQEGGVFMARTRHLVALSLAQDHLELASNVRYNPELFAEELRLVQRALSSITGEFTADDLLGEIFSRFCIGK
jgi:tRNA modification GTPase